MTATHKIILTVLWIFAGLLVMDSARAERLKDIASIAGVRNNQLIGYGIVVGLDGSGDQTTQTPFTVQSIVSMLSNMGVNLPPGQSLQLKNVAAVMVTATLPPFARAGQPIDVTASSIGNAKSLKGGMLVMTPLKGADGAVYAIAQGSLIVSGAGASGGGGAKVQVNHLSVGRIPGGATVEREVPMPVGQGEFVLVDLHDTNFGTARRTAAAINSAMGIGTATAVDGRQIRIRAPLNVDERVSFLGRLEELDVMPGQSIAKVIVNTRTGSVVMNHAVTLENCAVAHGNLSVAVSGDTGTGAPVAIDIKQEGGALLNVKRGANLADVIKALNALGANPQDLTSILQAMKAAGALRAELEVI